MIVITNHLYCSIPPNQASYIILIGSGCHGDPHAPGKVSSGIQTTSLCTLRYQPSCYRRLISRAAFLPIGFSRLDAIWVSSGGPTS